MTAAGVLAVTLVLCAGGCAGPGDGEAGAKAPSRQDPVLLQRRAEAAERTRVAPVEAREASASAALSASNLGETPGEIMTRLRADLQTRTDSAEATVVHDQAVIWPSGALGCPQPGRMYTQAQVPGYHVVFDVEGLSYDYRAAQRGGFRLCETAPAP